MALDPLEKDQLRRRMATRMQVIQEGGRTVVCVSAHFHDEPVFCDLCQQLHTHEQLVIRNRAGKNFHVDEACLREMVRFQVTDADDLAKWVGKMKEIKAEHEKRKGDLELAREEERRKLEKKIIVRRREPQSAAKG